MELVLHVVGSVQGIRQLLVMEHVDLKRCGRRGSDVLHSNHKLIMMLL